MNGSTIELALASDERFVMHLCVAAASLLKNADSSREIAFHIVHDGLSREAKSNFEALSSIRPFSVEWIGISHADFAEFEVPRNLSVMANVRLKLPSLLPSLGKALYLDCDIVAVDDIAKLWDESFDGKAVAAVSDYGIKTRKIERIGVVGREFFNSGVILMDLARMRGLKMVDRFAEVRKGALKPKNDQEVLNIALKGEWTALPLRWNVQAPVRVSDALENGYGDAKAVEAAIASPGIIHFTSHKPSSHLFDGLGGELYFENLALTPYRDFKIGDKTWRNRVIRSLPRGARTRARHLLARLPF
jgi:lipopolysaccharide biosynthesis glycosyltransferase